MTTLTLVCLHTLATAISSAMPPGTNISASGVCCSVVAMMVIKAATEATTFDEGQWRT